MKTTSSFVGMTLLIFSPFLLFSQTKNWNLEVGIGISTNLNFSFGKEKFPGIQVFANCMLNKKISENFIVSYGSTISFYTKSLGNDLNPLNQDLQIDFTNSFSVGAIFGDSLDYSKRMRTIHNSPAINLKHNYEYASIFSTIFILNNHKRNQMVGAFNGTAGPVSLNYYNDSGPVIQWLAISDNFDRWWTGGTGFYFHTKEGFNRAEFTFDQFTGYAPLIYELTTLLGIDIPTYNLKKINRSDSVPQNYNSSAYHLRIFWDQNNAGSIGMLGSLRTGGPHKSKKWRYFGLQDMTHISKGKALHPNNDKNRFFIGYSLNRFLHSQQFGE